MSFQSLFLCCLTMLLVVLSGITQPALAEYDSFLSKHMVLTGHMVLDELEEDYTDKVIETTDTVAPETKETIYWENILTEYSTDPPSQDVQLQDGSFQEDSSYDVLAEVTNLVGESRHQEACGLLSETNGDFQERQDEYLFLLARCNLGQSDYEAAYQAYQELETIVPDSETVQTEKKLVEKLIDENQNWDPEEIDLITTLIVPDDTQSDDVVLTDSSKSWFVRAELGGLYDTNINTGPSDNLQFAGLNAGPIEAFGYTYSLLGGYLYPIGDTNFLLARASTDYTDYAHSNNNAFGSYNVAVGPILSMGDISVSILPGFTWQTYAGQAYNNILDLSASAAYQALPYLTIGARSTVATTNYFDGDDFDSDSFNASPYIEFTAEPFGQKFELELSGTGFIEDAEDSINSNEQWSGLVRLEQNIVESFKLTFSYEESSSEYDTADILLNSSPREDDTTILIAGFSWDISKIINQENTSLDLEYVEIENESNTDIYSYEKETTTLSIVKNW